MLQATTDQHSPAFCRQVLDGEFLRTYRPDGSYELRDAHGRTPDEVMAADLDRQIAGTLAAMRVFKVRIHDVSRAYKSWKASNHPIIKLGQHRGEAIAALIQWREKRNWLRVLQAQRARLNVGARPAQMAAE